MSHAMQGLRHSAPLSSACFMNELVVYARWPRAFWFGWGELRIEECYIHDETADGGDAHIENIYVAGGANFVFCDGSVRTISYQIDREVHRRLGNRTDGLAIGESPY